MDSPSTFPYGLKYGLILATISLIIMFAMYAIDPELMFSAWYVNAIGFVITIVVMVLSVLEFRRDNNGGALFGQAIACGFFTYAVSTLIAMIGSYVLINVIDPSLIELQQKVAIDAAVSMLETFGAEEDVIEGAIEEIERQGSQTIGQMVMGYIFALFIGLVIALIVAAFTKKDRPVDYSDALN